MVELHLWDYNYCPNAGIAWPSHWPVAEEGEEEAPGVPRAPGGTRVYRQADKPLMCVEVKSSVTGRAFSVFLPEKEREEATRIITRVLREDRMCVVFGGIKYSAIMRVPLPGEEWWLRKGCASSHLPPELLPRTPPVLVLQMPDPWATAMGSEAPALVVYSDGLAVFGGTKCMRFNTGTFAPWDALLALLKEMPASHASLSNWTDQPETIWSFWGVPGDDSTKKRISVYGDMQGHVNEYGPIPDNILANK